MSTSWGSNYDKRVELAAKVEAEFVFPEKDLQVLWAFASSTTDELMRILHPDVVAKAKKQAMTEELSVTLEEFAEKKFKEADHPRGPGGVFVKVQNKASTAITQGQLTRQEAEAAAIEEEFLGSEGYMNAAKDDVRTWLQAKFGVDPGPNAARGVYDATNLKKSQATAAAACVKKVANTCELHDRIYKAITAVEKTAEVYGRREAKKAQIAKTKAKLDALKAKAKPKPKPKTPAKK